MDFMWAENMWNRIVLMLSFDVPVEVIREKMFQSKAVTNDGDFFLLYTAAKMSME